MFELTANFIDCRPATDDDDDCTGNSVVITCI